MNNSTHSTNHHREIDSIDSYFECVTFCSTQDDKRVCEERCVEILKNEDKFSDNN